MLAAASFAAAGSAAPSLRPKGVEGPTWFTMVTTWSPSGAGAASTAVFCSSNSVLLASWRLLACVSTQIVVEQHLELFELLEVCHMWRRKWEAALRLELPQPRTRRALRFLRCTCHAVFVRRHTPRPLLSHHCRRRLLACRGNRRFSLQAGRCCLRRLVAWSPAWV